MESREQRAMGIATHKPDSDWEHRGFGRTRGRAIGQNGPSCRRLGAPNKANLAGRFGVFGEAGMPNKANLARSVPLRACRRGIRREHLTASLRTGKTKPISTGRSRQTKPICEVCQPERGGGAPNKANLGKTRADCWGKPQPTGHVAPGSRRGRAKQSQFARGQNRHKCF